jgi:uncharacterized repeat protein (TIGR01451 family)
MFVRVLVLVALVVLWAAPSALAGPVWRVDALGDSTVASDGTLTYLVEFRNVGDAVADATAEPITLSGTLPAGMAFVSGPFFMSCTSSGQSFTCTGNSFTLEPLMSGPAFYGVAPIQVSVEPSVTGVQTASFTIEGGDPSDGDPTKPAASTVASIDVTRTATFGIAAFDSQVSGDIAGTPFTQAGGHPFSQTTSIDFNTYRNPDPLKSDLTPVEATKDLDVELPPGFLGNPSGVGQCSLKQLAIANGASAEPDCPVTSQVGTTFIRANGAHMLFGPVPVFNMQPPVNAPARLGFNVAGVVVTIDVTVRSPGDYGLTAHARNLPEALATAGSTLTLWGVPSDPVHDPERACTGQRAPYEGGPTCSSGAPHAAFLRNPTSCTPPGVGLPTTLRMDSWMHPGVFVEKTIRSHTGNGYPYAEGEWGALAGTTGCGKVPFDPGLTVTPGSGEADSPAGFAFDLTMPQPNEAETIGESDLRKTMVMLPPGVRVDPSSAGGLAACSPAQIGLHELSEPACPDASKIGTVSIKTPALENPLTGSVYLATPNENPFGTLLAIYLVAQGSGVTLKLPGKVELDPATGRLTTTIDESPQAPFTDVHLEFAGGPRAALTTPQACGTYTTNAQFTGWSGKTVASDPTFAITTGAGGGACATPGFAPSFTAGTTSNRAGAFSPFVLSFSRNDGEQQIAGLTDTFPPGASAVLKGVAQCTDAQVKQAEEGIGGCPEASRIGSVTVASGAGPDPYFLKGSIYLTGPYNNGPFGEAVIVPAVAGPFNLGNVVVRGSIRIDPHTAQPTVVSDPFPQFVKQTGIPTDVKRIDVLLDRPGFTFNPTNCSELKATATLTGAQGATANVSSRFQAAECERLAFKPKFTVTATGHPTRRAGAGLSVRISYPRGAEANLRAVRVRLPKQLPSRLTTLQKACPGRVFDANPANCPAASRVGVATVATPLLASTLSGPAYFVSHGIAKFPDLAFVLQGEGVTVVLTGETFINEKTNVTTTTFRGIPDTPVSAFALSLPQGPNSALAGHLSLCGRHLTMPTLLDAQNGAVIHQSTRIAVTGCAKHRAGRHRRHGHGHKKR